ncbi:MAG: ferrous iron transport protein A [Pirellulales bacterium]
MSTLAEIKVGESVRVVRVEGEDAIGLRLQEMGLTPGVEVAMIGMAPLGDPIEFQVRGYRLSLRKREADRVDVAPV